ncbi:shikimate dehydrogenase [Poseidonocella sedimentorum]|uniref:Shikimate dehydrogenase (NADP(+)) n=1 Tax=Poseidonocella sedimentorum TaxID=871652 RepID=A0A1I6D6R0_9RHOB|nr:shikimate dehydrogenase [Poseidonocella sedimentorum]SFR01093.1 shikimate dehydrogenase [Poseidonocella sedimentorum]
MIHASNRAGGRPLAGVIGDPIAHSKSPRMHRFWLDQLGIDGHYVPLHVKDGDLEAVLRAMPKMGFVGTNVTIPHKETAIKLADEISSAARAIGAANTLTFGADGRIHADNTDAYGFLANLRQQAPGWAPDGPALLLGAGGAARAVIAALQEAGVGDIRLCNRTRARAEDLASAFGAGVSVLPWEDTGDAVGDCSLLVNTTSLGMVGKPSLDLALDKLSASTIVSDLVYVPLDTGLLRAAKDKGCTTVDGLGMLLHQGVPGFERWFGARPEVTPALREALLA